GCGAGPATSARRGSRSVATTVSGAGRREELVGVALGLDLGPHRGDFPFLVDQVCHAPDAHELAAVHVVLAPRAVVLHDLLVGVGEQREGERELVGKLLVRLLVVGRDSENRDLLPAEFRPAVAKGAGLLRTAWRVVLRATGKYH